jgi:hypothetical protein
MKDGCWLSHIHADEKVVIEVETMKLIGEKTTVPVPKFHKWGLAQLK